MKKQAGLLITEKIEKELMVMSPNLRREIKKISTGQNAIEVVFKNGSSFIASCAGEQSRGLNILTHINRNIYIKIRWIRGNLSKLIIYKAIPNQVLWSA